jgi:putative membrane protein insertion efficiency factor
MKLLRVRLVVPLLLVAVAAADLTRAPGAQVSARIAVSAIHWYQSHLSGHLGLQCRFKPTCSQYALEVYRRHGFIVGSGRTLWRIARCGPWTPLGTVDLPD